METDFQFSDVPTGYQLCFNKECPHKETCLRWVAANKVPNTLKWGPAVYPTALEADGKCPYFHKATPKRMAWGFGNLFYDVLQRDAKGIRIGLQEYLGGRSNFYRYARGEKMLSPEQQEWILDYFRKRGYTKNLTFQNYYVTYDFRH